MSAPSDPGQHSRSTDVVEVDSRGQRCPLPVLALAKALAGAPPGTAVRLLATDPAAQVDVPAFCRMRGVELVAVSDDESSGEVGGGRYTAYLVRPVSASAPAAEPPGPPRGSPGTPGATPP